MAERRVWGFLLLPRHGVVLKQRSLGGPWNWEVLVPVLGTRGPKDEIQSGQGNFSVTAQLEHALSRAMASGGT